MTQNNTPHSQHTYLPCNQQQSKEDTKPSPAAVPATKAISPEEVPRPSVATEEDEYVNAKSTYRISPHGRFGVLQLEKHRSSASGNFEDHDLTFVDEDNRQHVFHHSDVVNYEVEVNQVFRFVPDSRF